MNSNPEIGDAILRCSNYLQQLAADLPAEAELELRLEGRHLTTTIYIRDATNKAYRWVTRLEPNESPEYLRELFAKDWAIARYKLLGSAE